MKDCAHKNKRHNPPPLISIVGKSGAGKTTLLEKLIPELVSSGLTVGTVKHDVHGFEMDRPGKDSWRHKEAGSATTIISSPSQIGMVRDVNHDHTLDELLAYFSDRDIVLSEGYKRETKPKVEIFRVEAHDTPLCVDDENLIAIMTDTEVDLGVPRFNLDNIKGLVRFLVNYCKNWETNA